MRSGNVDDFDDLLTPTRKRGRPSNADRAARMEQAAREAEMQAEFRKAAQGHQSLQIDQFLNPVPQNFLARLMNMDPATVNKRLEKCKPAAVVGQRKVYWFHEAIHYLVKPKMTAEQFARTLNKTDLPAEINKSFWDAQRSRVKYKIEAQEAWETEDVLEVLGDVAMTLKDSLVSVVEEMRNRAKLDDAQTEILSAALDEIRTEIRRKLIELPTQKATGAMFAKPMFGVAEEIDREPDVPVDPWSDEDDDE
jgi:hypothetical protein